MNKDFIKESEDFYNKFDSKLIKDYLLGNPRTEGAIKHTLKFLSENNYEKILDIGCGLGWSSYEIAKHFPKSDVLGIDLSQELNKCAQQLFGLNNLKYAVQDITASEFLTIGKFDAIVLLDVYEHIPIEMRNEFNLAINSILNDNGIVILTCPSIYHQNFLREQDPEGLQPVDEDITINEMQELSSLLNAQISFFSFNTIFRQNDYTYTVIKKGLSLVDKDKKKEPFKPALDDKKIRFNRIFNSNYADVANSITVKKTTSLVKLKNVLIGK